MITDSEQPQRSIRSGKDYRTISSSSEVIGGTRVTGCKDVLSCKVDVLDHLS